MGLIIQIDRLIAHPSSIQSITSIHPLLIHPSHPCIHQHTSNSFNSFNNLSPSSRISNDESRSTHPESTNPFSVIGGGGNDDDDECDDECDDALDTTVDGGGGGVDGSGSERCELLVDIFE
jgi:hypothetical protein